MEPENQPFSQNVLDDSDHITESENQPSDKNDGDSPGPAVQEEKTITTRQTLPFPPEIRTMIYKHVLDASPRFPKGYTRRPKQHFTSRFFDLSLLLVSKQTFLEAFHIFYRMNQLCFRNTHDLLRFLRHIGPLRRQEIVSIALNRFDCYAKQAFRLLQTCSKLERIRMTMPYYEPTGFAALREVRGLKTVHITRVDGMLHQNERLWNRKKLKKAMMRPRLKKYEADPHKVIDVFAPRREIFRKTEVERLAIDMLTWPLLRRCPYLV